MTPYKVGRILIKGKKKQEDLMINRTLVFGSVIAR